MAIYTFDFSEDDGNWTLVDANISGGTLNITVVLGYGQRSPDINWLSDADDDFEIEFDFLFGGSFQALRVVLKLSGDALSILFDVRATYDYMRIYYDGIQRANQTIDIEPSIWYTGKIRRVGTVYYFSINGGDEISWDYGTERALEYLKFQSTVGPNLKFDNFIYRWIEEGIIKVFEDTFTGTENLLSDKNLIFLDSMLGTDEWVLPNITYKTFSDVLIGSDNFLRDLTALFEDTFTGVDIIKVDKMVIFSDSLLGVDVFLLEKEAVFKDVFSAIEKFYASYPYPRNLKRKIIIIRDIK